jgi:hypothetical protein
MWILIISILLLSIAFRVVRMNRILKSINRLDKKVDSLERAFSLSIESSVDSSSCRNSLFINKQSSFVLLTSHGTPAEQDRKYFSKFTNDYDIPSERISACAYN